MQRPVVTTLSSICVAGAALTASANASAQHYYAQHLAVIYGNADNGASTSIWTNILHSTCNAFQHDFVNHELWYGVTSNASYWVEVGFKDGVDGGGGCLGHYLFWADNRNGGGYNEHYSQLGWAYGGWYPLQVSSAGSCVWTVLFNGSAIGTSTNNCPGSGRVLEAGIETTSQTTGSAQGWLGNWWEESGSGNWRQGWDNDYICQSSGNGSCNSGNPQIKWASGIGTEEVLNEPF